MCRKGIKKEGKKKEKGWKKKRTGLHSWVEALHLL